MPEYRVTWEIDVEADDAVSAAREAQRSQRKIGTWANVFDCWSDAGQVARVDLAEHDGPEVPFQAEMVDWRAGDGATALTGDDLKPWPVKITKVNGTSIDIQLKAPDGTSRAVWLEIEGGDLRVRVYPDETLGDDPAGELRLKPGAEKAEAVFDT